MSLLKNLGDKALNTAKIVGNKSQDAMEVGKLKMQISQVEGEIKKLKSEIGEVAYNEFLTELTVYSEPITTLCNNITEKISQIEELKLKIDEVKND